MKNAFFENSRFCITVPLSHKNMAANDSQPMGQSPSPSTDTTVELRISYHPKNHVVIKGFVFLFGDSQVTQRNLWGAVTESPLEHRDIQISLITIVFVLAPAPSLSARMRSYILLDSTGQRCFLQDLTKSIHMNTSTFSAGEQEILRI